MVWAARVIPSVLIGIIGYVSWVVTRVVVCKKYSLQRPVTGGCRTITDSVSQMISSCMLTPLVPNE